MYRSLLTLIAIVLPPIGMASMCGATELTLKQTMSAGTEAFYDHHEEIVLADGFWAQTGSDVTATIHQATGYYIDKTPLDAKDKQYTSNDSRSFVVAGCVPKHYPAKFSVSGGSVWLACNDLDYVKDKVEESTFISCLDLYQNGVLQGFSLKEVNNRTWQSFRFSCRDLEPDGTMGSATKDSKFLFHFQREGKLYDTTVPVDSLAFGVFETYNQLQLLPRENLLQIGIEYAKATAIHDAGRKNRVLDDFNVSERVPNAFGIGGLVNISHWNCPPGTVMTGAAIGHNPDNKGNDTRPIYILAECRKLLHNP